MTREERSTIHVSLPKSIIGKMRGMVDTMPGNSINIFFEELVLKEIASYEDQYGEIDPSPDLYFNAARRTKKTRI